MTTGAEGQNELLPEIADQTELPDAYKLAITKTVTANAAVN